MKFHCNHFKIIINQFQCLKKDHSNFPNDFLYPYLGVHGLGCIPIAVLFVEHFGCGKLINAFYIIYPNFDFTFVGLYFNMLLQVPTQHPPRLHVI